MSTPINPARQIRTLKIEKIVDHTENVRELVLSCLEPTQFVFKAGQFIMLHVPTADPTAKPALRAYSISSTEAKTDGFRLLFKYVENGLASKFVWDLKGHETLNFTGPFGRVFFQEPPTEQIVFLNTGTGISQHLSYLESKRTIYPHLKYRMYFGVRSESDIYIQTELDQLQKEMEDFKYDFVLSRPSESWKGKKGYVQHYLNELDLSIPTTFYLCGNGGMIKDVKSRLEEMNFDKSRIFAEAFD